MRDRTNTERENEADAHTKGRQHAGDWKQHIAKRWMASRQESDEAFHLHRRKKSRK